MKLNMSNIMQPGHSPMQQDNSLMQQDNSLMQQDNSLMQQYNSLMQQDNKHYVIKKSFQIIFLSILFISSPSSLIHQKVYFNSNVASKRW